MTQLDRRSAKIAQWAPSSQKCCVGVTIASLATIMPKELQPAMGVSLENGGMEISGAIAVRMVNFLLEECLVGAKIVRWVTIQRLETKSVMNALHV